LKTTFGRAAVKTYSTIDLGPYRNAASATFDAERDRAAVNAWGNSLPAEEMPAGPAFELAGVTFSLPERPGGLDRVEALGQTITLARPLRASGIALLGFGEMGDQSLEIELCSGRAPARRLDVLAHGWLSDEGGPAEDCYRFSHLHYPGGYELSSLRPALWCSKYEWGDAAPLTKVVLGRNPLFHLFALTCWHEN
jgi:hypothetical protein